MRRRQGGAAPLALRQTKPTLILSVTFPGLSHTASIAREEEDEDKQDNDDDKNNEREGGEDDEGVEGETQVDCTPESGAHDEHVEEDKTVVYDEDNPESEAQIAPESSENM
jgi:hypothetical protein